MIIDANAFVGQCPFRAVDGDPDSLIDRLDRHGVDAALVSAFEGILFRNCHEANVLLADRLEGFRDRLRPVATLNPLYAGAKRDLVEAVETFDMAAVKLLPAYHHYDLDEPAVIEFVEACVELDIPIIVAIAIEDQRQRHPAVKLHGLPENHRDYMTEEQADALIELLKTCPEVDVVIADAWKQAVRIEQAVRPHKDGLHFMNAPHRGERYFVLGDLFMFSPFQGEELVDELGPDRLCHGPMLPLKVYDAAALCLEHLPVTDAERDRIAGGNIHDLIK